VRRAGVGCEQWKRRSHGGCIIDLRVYRSFLGCGSAVAKVNDMLVFILRGIAGEGKNILRFVVTVNSYYYFF
jgi:hypothetical protein